MIKNVLTLFIVVVTHFVITVDGVTTRHPILHIEIARASPWTSIVPLRKVTFLCSIEHSKRSRLTFYIARSKSSQGFNLQEVHKDRFCTDILIHSHSILFQLPLPYYDVILMADVLRSWCVHHTESLVINEVKVTSIAAVARSTGICIIGIHDAVFFLT